MPAQRKQSRMERRLRECTRAKGSDDKTVWMATINGCGLLFHPWMGGASRSAGGCIFVWCLFINTLESFGRNGSTKMPPLAEPLDSARERAGRQTEAVIDDVVGALARLLSENEGLMEMSWVVLGVCDCTHNHHKDIGCLGRVRTICWQSINFRCQLKA